MKYLIFIIDGAADYPVDSLGNKTPLQAAKKPNIDKLTKLGKCGKLITLPKGMPTGSAVANLSILGYDVKKDFTGRGPLEAAAMNIDLADDEIAFRCNIVTERNNILLDYSSGHISNEEAHNLIDMLNKKFSNEKIKFHKGVSYRHILTLKGEEFSPKLDCKPPHDYIGTEISKILPKARFKNAKKTEKVILDLIKKTKPYLENNPINLERKNPANLIWPWSPGKKPEIKTFQELYGLKGAVISAVDIIFGIGKLAGMDMIKVEGATGLYDTNYEGKADACIEALKDHDLVWVHVEAPDEAGHAGDAKLKLKTIEDFDKRLLRRVLLNIDLNNTSIAILPDHYTPIKIKTHTPEPVPFIIYNPDKEGDNVKKFDEFFDGSYGVINNDVFIEEFLKK